MDRFNELLVSSVENAGYLWDIIPYLSESVIDEYRIRLATISELNSHSIAFDVEMMLSLKKPSFSIYSFLEDLIDKNSCDSLAALKFDSIYRSLFWIEEGEKLNFVTHEYLELVKMLAEKFMVHKYIHNAFKTLQSVCKGIRPSFVARLLLIYLDGKFMNRLIEVHDSF